MNELALFIARAPDIEAAQRTAEVAVEDFFTGLFETKRRG
jgi:hypothetical protein